MKKQVNLDLINQALMANAQTDLVSHVDRERQPGHSIGLQLFICKGQTRMSRLRMVYLTKDYELMEYHLAPLRIHHSVSNVPSYRNRIMYIQVSMDKKEYLNDDGQRVVNNANPFKFDELMSENKTSSATGKVYPNHNNSAIVSGVYRLAPVPAVFADPEIIKQYNLCSRDIMAYHAKAVEQAKEGGYELTTSPAYRKLMDTLYKAYQDRMTTLLTAGVLEVAQVLNVADNNLIPALTADSEMEADNPYFNSKLALREHISFMPTYNHFSGYIRIDSSATADDINPDLATGLRPLGRDGDNAELTSTKAKRQEATRLGHVADSFGNQSSILVRRQDVGYVNPRNPNQQGLAETFMNMTSNNDGLFVTGKVLPVVATKDVGGNANGILRSTVVVSDYTRHRSVSIMSSMDSSLDLNGVDLDKLGLDDGVSLTGQQDFSLDTFDAPAEAVTPAEQSQVQSKPADDFDNGMSIL